MKPYELRQLGKKRKQQEKIIRDWFASFSIKSEKEITEPKEIQAICELNPTAIELIQYANNRGLTVSIKRVSETSVMNKFVVVCGNKEVYL